MYTNNNVTHAHVHYKYNWYYVECVLLVIARGCHLWGLLVVVVGGGGS
jgi:hypothetical protein